MRSSLLASVLVLTACAHHPAATVPMRSIYYPAAKPSDTVVVMLPGLKDRALVFERARFVEAFQRHDFPADLIAVDAHVGYYTNGTVLRRLHEDVMAMASQRYAHVVLVGVSMGAYGAIRYAMAYPQGIDEIVLFSPFLGPFMRWIAEPGDEDFQQTWAWLRSSARPRIVLAYGHEDAFLASDRKLRALLPPTDVATATGAHVWGTWHRLLEQLLQRGL